jgi:hypothetical protein
MAEIGGLLTKRALVLAAVQSAAGVAVALSPLTDAAVVSEPQWAVDAPVVERNNSANDLSSFEHILGRKKITLTFTHELRSNGLASSGSLADAPMLAKLMRGCGYEVSSLTGAPADAVMPVVSSRGNPTTSPDISWTPGGTPALASPVLYTVTVVTPGITGVAEVLLTSNNPDGDDLSGAVAVTLTDGVALTLGAGGATVTPEWVGTLTTGMVWTVFVTPPGLQLRPRSDGFERLTIAMYMDGRLATVSDAVGKFTIDAASGEFGRVSFEFEGLYTGVTDVPTPQNAVFEETQPPLVENSLLTFGSNVNLVAQQWTFDSGNAITERPDVNSPEGFRGSRISDRAVIGTFNPEATLEADEAFWGDFTSAKAKVFTAKVGDRAGDGVAIYAPRVQTSNLTGGDRDGTSTYDVSLAFRRHYGDDEVRFFFF